jgi:hypothetical protein
MTIQNDALREDLRAWIRSPAIELRDYWADVIVQRRVGRMLADIGGKPSACAQDKVVNSIQIRLPDKL